MAAEGREPSGANIVPTNGYVRQCAPTLPLDYLSGNTSINASFAGRLAPHRCHKSNPRRTAAINQTRDHRCHKLNPRRTAAMNQTRAAPLTTFNSRCTIGSKTLNKYTCLHHYHTEKRTICLSEIHLGQVRCCANDLVAYKNMKFQNVAKTAAAGIRGSIFLTGPFV